MSRLPVRPARSIILAAAATALLSAVSGVSAPAATAVGILPPGNPAANIAVYPPDPGNVCPDGVAAASSYAPCIELQLQEIDNARAQEGVGPMRIPADFASLTPAEQLFEVVGQERVDRGLNAPIGMYSNYDQEALVAARSATDPALRDGALTGIWAAGMSNTTALQADYRFMYDDGLNSGNLDCVAGSTSGCWSHRDDILATFGGLGQSLYVGSAFATGTAYPGSFALETAPAPSGTLDFAFQPGTATLPPPSICDKGLGGGVVGMAGTGSGHGYWIASRDGPVSHCGDAADLGQPPAGAAIAAIAASPDGKGFWEVTYTGTVYHFGDAAFHGDLRGVPITRPIVAMAADPATGGYWLLGADGGVFSFDAPFYGSTGNMRLVAPAVGMQATADGHGYRFVAADGGIFDYGDAEFLGSAGDVHLARPVIGMTDDPATGGYWLIAADGGVFSFDAPFYGSTGNLALASPCVGMTALSDGSGYRFVAADGGVFDFAAATFDGSAAA